MCALASADCEKTMGTPEVATTVLAVLSHKTYAVGKSASFRGVGPICAESYVCEPEPSVASRYFDAPDAARARARHD